MATRSKFRHEDVATVPRGHRVRTVTTPTGHKVRIAFPPGPRRTGAGKLVSILHPQTEVNPCGKNPMQELVKDSKGNEWWVNILGGEGRGFTAEGFPVTGKKLKRVGHPLVARGRSEGEAGDALIDKIEKRSNPAKSRTREQVEKMQYKAVTFLRDVVKDSAKADEIAGLSVEEYAAKKKIALANPRGKSKGTRQKAKGKRQNAQKQRELGKAKEVTRGGGIFSFGRGKEYWEFDVADRTYQVRKGKGMKKLPVKDFKIDAATGRVYNPQGQIHASAKLHKVGRHPAPRTQHPARRRKNLDEIDEAQKLYEAFQGKAATEVLDLHEPDAVRDDFAKLGWLISLRIQPRTTDKAIDLNFKADKVILASNAEGSQLYALGGKQDLNGCLKLFQTDESKDFVELGEAESVVYLTRKAQANFELSEFEHEFGEEGGELPFLFYNRLQKRIFFVGGDYTVESPGIIN